MASKKVLLGGPNDDRISNLPDGLLILILSFLPTIYSVRTRVLSQRWKSLFTYVPTLDFEFPSPRISRPLTLLGYPPLNIRASSNSFVNFVNSVFSAYNVPKMRKFRLIHNTELLDVDIDLVTWITIAVCRCVLELDIAVIMRLHQTLPRHVFSSDTLTILRIEGSFNILLPETVYLPCLRVCHFYRVWFSIDSAQRLFRSCPVLEDLMLNDCNMREVQILEISSLTLHRFSIRDRGTDYPLMLDAPNLQNFMGLGHAYRALIGLSNREFLRLLANKVCPVPSISIHASFVQAFRNSSHSLSEYPNLTSLKFSYYSTLELQFLLEFLEMSPRLEVLVLLKEVGDEGNEKEDTYISPKHVPTCLLTHIKNIEIRSFSMLGYELELVEYILKNALCLEKLKIHPNMSREKETEISKKVLAFPKCSTTCEIVFEKVEEAFKTGFRMA